MDPAAQALVTYLKQNRTIPMEKLRELCLSTGYTKEQIDTAVALLDAPSETAQETEPAPSTPAETEAQTNEPVPIISVDPINRTGPKKQGFSLLSLYTIVHVSILGSVGLTIIASLTAVAFLASSSAPR